VLTVSALGLDAWPFVGRRSECERITDALADPRVRAAVITGESGVGKSRLAQECVWIASDLGVPASAITSAPGVAGIPFAALAPLVPDGVELTDAATVFEKTRAQVAARAGDGRFLLAIDDIDNLDPASIGLIAALLAERAVFLVATLRDETLLPEALAALWRGGHALRVELAPLQRSTVDTLLHLSLRGPVSARAGQALWEACLGNVLYLRELVQGAQERGALSNAYGVWMLTGALRGGAAIADLLRRRLAGLGAAERAVLELLALCEPLGLDELLEHTGAEALGRLEQAGLISVAPDGRRHPVAVAHPLHASVLRDGLTRLATRAILLAQVERLRRYGVRRVGDPLLLASWLVGATGAAEPAVLHSALSLARDQYDLAALERLAAAALRQRSTVELATLLGEALAELGRAAEAEQLLASAEGDEAGPDARVRLAAVRAHNLWYGLGRRDAALAVVRAEPGPLTSTVEALLLADTGAPVAAQAVLDRVPAGSALWHLADAAITLQSGRYGDLVAAADRARLAREAGEVLSNPVAPLLFVAVGLIGQGRFEEAQAVIDEGRRRLAGAGVGPLAVRFAALAGRAALQRGRPATAATALREALAAARAADAPAMVAAALTELLAYCVALAPGVEFGFTPVQIDEHDPDDDGMVATSPDRVHADPYGPQVRAWLLAQRGELGAARRRLADAAQRCAAVGRLAEELMLRHDIARLGEPATQVDRVQEVAAGMQGELVATVAAHVRALAARDAVALSQVGESFAALGANLYAAEALTAAAAAYRAATDGRAATRAGHRAAELAALCEGATTPALRQPSTVVPLSRREREVALLAAAGQPSRAIAESLFLSVRTVDNHLASVYAKLGVSSRTDLAAVLGAGERAGSMSHQGERTR